jgi:hypothetical protein
MTACVALIIAGATGTLAKHKDDVVIMKNGDRITGEIKSLKHGELIFLASYMVDAVRLDWSKVARLESKDSYLISMADGYQFTEQVKVEDSGTENFHMGEGGAVKVSQMNVVRVRILPIETNFWQQLEGSINFGLSFTSGNDQYDASLSSDVTYRRGDSSLSAGFDTSFSGQPKGTKTARNQLTLDYRRQLSPRWFAGGSSILYTAIS